MKIMSELALVVFLVFQLLIAQNYNVNTPQITGGQQSSSSDNYNLSSNTATQSADASSSDSLSFSPGIMGVTKGLYALPPVVSAFIADTIYRDGMPIRVQGILTDLNGIASADLHLQLGGSQEPIIIPMTALNDSIYEV